MRSTPDLFIPLTTDRPRTKKPRLVYTLLILNTIVFLWTLTLPQQGAQSIRELYFNYGVSKGNFEWYQLLTSAFLHAGWMHIISNMIVLAALGPNVEDKLGHFGFGVLYVTGAAASGFVHIISSENPAVGASGAIAAVTGAYFVLFPKTRITCLMIFFIIGRIVVPAWWFIGLNIVIDLFANFGRDSGVAHAAHLGGYGFGIVTMLALLWVRVLEREPYDLFSVIKQRKRRADFAAAARMHNQAVERQVGAAKEETPEQRALNEGRIAIGQLVSAGRLDEAADRYRVFVDEFGVEKPGTSLSRDLQLRLAEHLVRTDDRATAVKAYQAFCVAYPSDRETPTSLLMTGLMLVKNLGRPGDAKPILEKALPKLHGDERGLAEDLLRSVADSSAS